MQTFAFDEKYVEFLRDFGIEDIDRSDLSVVQFEKGEVVCRENQRNSHFYICVSGHGRSFVNERNGKSLILNIFKKGYVIGDYELIKNFPPMTTVIADTLMLCISIPLNKCRGYLIENNVFLLKVSEILANKLYASLQHSVASRLMPLEYRLSIHLKKVSPDGVFNARLTDTAEMLTTSYRHLLRAIHHLTEKNILTKTSEGYKVDINKLNKHIEDF